MAASNSKKNLKDIKKEKMLSANDEDIGSLERGQ